MSTSGPRVNTAKNTTGVFDGAFVCFYPCRFKQVVEANDAAGYQKIREKPLRIGFSCRSSGWTYDRDNPNTRILSAFPISVASPRISMYMKLMDFSTQRARLLFESEMTFLQEFGYAIFDCAVFTVILGAPSVHCGWGAAYFMSTREENFLSAHGSHYRQVCVISETSAGGEHNPLAR